MKTIGIKLADGSFYPIMQEGSAEKRELNLTTVKDNQTTVQVDLYRSESGTMEDAEYVDSLEIKNLVKHPNGEPDISLDISLDENNELKAELHDPETGKDSNTTVDLVSLSLDQISEQSDVTEAATESTEDSSFDDLSSDLDFDAETFDLDESLSSSEPQETFDGDDDLTLDPNSLNVDSIVEEEASTETEEDNSAETAAVIAGAAGVGLLGAAAAMAASKEETVESTESVEEPADDFSVEDFTIPDDFETEESSESFEDTASVEENDFSAEDLSIPDDFGSETVESSESSTIEETDFSADDLSIPDDFGSETEEVSESSDTFDAFDSTETFETTENSETESDDFSLDDISFPDEFDSTESFDSTETFETTEVTETTESDNIFNDDFDNSGNAGLDFSDILDEETKEGYAGTPDSENCKKKVKVPVIICIVCAVICILAVLLMLFVIPTSFNILKKPAKTPVKVEQPAPVAVEEKKEEPKYEAKEDEIVVAPAEEVIPEVPAKTETESKNITYKIKWGDTLWDISKSYYNNPWKYPKIAKYNGIKNPDHIISGTKIVIPAE